MSLNIHTPDCRLAVRTATAGAAFGECTRAAANDVLLDDAAAFLREALIRLDGGGSPVVAAYVDHALSMLRVERLVRDGG